MGKDTGNLNSKVLGVKGRRGAVEFATLVIVAFSIAGGFTRYLVMENGTFPYPSLLVIVGSAGILYYLRRGGEAEIAAWVLIAVISIAIAAGAYKTGGYEGPAILLTPLLPLLATFLLGVGAAGLSIVVVGIILGVLYYLELKGLVPPNSNPQNLVMTGRLVSVFAVSAISALFVWYFARRTDKLFYEIERQSNTDYLTGIMNRRAIELILKREIGRARRDDEWLSLIILDVDFFKLYNDNNGHQAGDARLIEIANLIQSSTKRAADAVGRYGGEEFIVILPKTTVEGAQKVAEDIQQTMKQHAIPYGPRESKTMTLTLGIATGKGKGIEDMSQLVRLADEALYQGKREGRDCVISVTLGKDLAQPATQPDALEG